MELSINILKYVKQVENNIKIDIPESPIAWQEHNYSVIYGIFPKLSTWEEVPQIYALNIIKIYGNNIESVYISLDKRRIEFILSVNNNKDESISIERHFFDYIMNFPGENSITIETFKEKFESCVNEIRNIF